MIHVDIEVQLAQCEECKAPLFVVNGAVVNEDFQLYTSGDGETRFITPHLVSCSLRTRLRT